MLGASVVAQGWSAYAGVFLGHLGITIPESIAYIDTDRRYKFVNNTFLRMRGKARHEVIGRTSEEVLGADAARLADPFVARALAGETVTYERLCPVMSTWLM